MGKEDIGFIISLLSIFKTIDSNYFVSPSNGYALEALLTLEDYTDNGIFNKAKQFFQDIFDLYICTDNNLLNLDLIRKKLYLMENLHASINSMFTNSLRNDIFTISDVQKFYTHSYSLLYNLKYLIQHIEIKEEHFNNNEFEEMNTIQNNYRSYILDIFWNKYFMSLSQTSLYAELKTIEQINTLITSVTQKTATTNNSSLERFLIQLTVLYDKKKTLFFDQINYESQFFNDLKSKQVEKQVYLYFYKNLNCLEQNYAPNYTHNLLGSDTSSKNPYLVNTKEQKFHVKYHINGLKEAYNIFIHSFYKNHDKKIFVGFAFKDEEHYQESISQFLYDTQLHTLYLYGKFSAGEKIIAVMNHTTNTNNLVYQWEKNSLDAIHSFTPIDNETSNTFLIPDDDSYTNYSIRCQINISLVNGSKKTISSKPYLIH